MIHFQREERVLAWSRVVNWRSSCEKGPDGRWGRDDRVPFTLRTDSRTQKASATWRPYPNSPFKWLCVTSSGSEHRMLPAPPPRQWDTRSNTPYTFVCNEKQWGDRLSLQNVTFATKHCHDIFILKVTDPFIRNTTSWVVSTWDFGSRLPLCSVFDGFPRLSAFLWGWTFFLK